MKSNKIAKFLSYITILFSLGLLTIALVNLNSFKKQQPFLKLTNFDQFINIAKSKEIKEYTTSELNLILESVDNKNFSETQNAKIKREIIRSIGFSNFDWKETLDDPLSFLNLKIEIIELQTPLIAYRRGYPDEPTSKYGLGKWWSDKSRSVIQARDDLAILENWGNPLTSEYIIEVPSGIRMLKGKAAPQKFKNPSGQLIETRVGGGIQFYIDSVKNDWLKK
jgi:hypothetical protein